jgi:hypothetical protein
VGEDGVVVSGSLDGVGGSGSVFSTFADVDGGVGGGVVSGSFFEQPAAINPRAARAVKMSFRRCMFVFLSTLRASAYSPGCGSVQSPFCIVFPVPVLDSNTALELQSQRR